MSHPVVRKTAITVALVWLTVFLLVVIQSVLNVTIAGVAPEAVRLHPHDDVPLHRWHIDRHRGNRIPGHAAPAQDRTLKPTVTSVYPDVARPNSPLGNPQATWSAG